MKLTTRGRYAVTAMLDLAINGGSRPVSLADISGRQEISLSYLEQLFAKLRREQLVTSARGPGGGYRLARSGAEIFVAEIIDAVDESVDVTNCQGKGNCHQGDLSDIICGKTSLDQIHDFLSQISLGDLMDGRGRRPVSR